MDPIVTARALENQGKRLRKMAATMLETKVFPTAVETSIGKILCSVSVLDHLDVIDFATDLEADAAKLRRLYH